MNNRKLLMPINIIILFLISTVVLYFLGPIKWEIKNTMLLLVVLGSFYFSYYLGYIFYILKKKSYYKKNFILNKITIKKNLKIFRISSIYNILFNIVLAKTLGGFSVNKILSPGAAYKEKLFFDYLTVDPLFVKTAQVMSYFAVLSYFYYPIGLVCYKNLKIRDKILFHVSLATTILYYINFGTFKGLADIGIIYLAIKIYDRGFNQRKFSIKNLKIYVVITILLLGFIGIQSSRGNTFKNKNVINRRIKKFVKFESKDVNYGIKSIIVYYTHAYTGLSYSLNLPFEWTYGLGNSRALTEISKNFFDIDISKKTYLQRLEDKYQWPNGMVWSTVFPWLASDFTYYLIPLIMFLLGLFLAKLYFEIIYRQNIIALIFYCQMFIFSFYIPANNQLLQSKISFFGTIGLVCIYLFRRKK